MKKTLSLLLGVAISGALLWLAFRKADIAAVGALIGGVDVKYALLVGATVLGELVIRGLKWALLLGRCSPTNLWTATRLTASGLALNNIFPFRFGEIARISLSAAHFRLNVVSLVAAVLAEKILDAAALAALCICAISAGGMLPAGFAARFLPESTWLTALLVTAVIAALILATRFSGFHRIRDSFLSGLRAFRSPATGTALFIMAVIQWLLNALNYYWLSPAFGAASAVDIQRSILLSATGAAASSVPGVPGYFGSFELAVTSVIKSWGIAPDPALSYAAAAHLLPYLIITAAGLLLLWRTDYPIRRLWNAVLLK